MHRGQLRDRYRDHLGLLTDLYALTMACAAFRLGRHEHEAVFNLVYRRNPFDGGYCIACGLHDVIEFLESFHVADEDVAYLRTLTGADDAPLFDEAFLAWLRDLRFTGSLDAVPEGTVVFPNEPLLRIQGSIVQCQIIEAALLNLINFQTLIATKAARVCEAAKGEPVLEFGLRRAQGVDGAISASRSAYVGGCAATSNTLAGKLLGIPVRGTHAHSWVMCFDDELEAFDAYARAMPNNCVLLVDTYDTLVGVDHAIEIGRRMRERGASLSGIRLDSGDLAYLSIEARKRLDAADLTDVAIVASNDLDELIIRSLKAQDAEVRVWGVGTSLATGRGDPALGGVCKLSAIREPGGPWRDTVKVSDQTAKISTPGIPQIRRFTGPDGLCVGDLVYDERFGVNEDVLVDPLDPTRRRTIEAGSSNCDLLQPIIRDGAVVYARPDLEAVRARTQAELARFHPGIRRFVNPHTYPVGLEPRLHELRMRLIVEARARS